MPVGKGRTKDKTLIVTDFGCRIKFTNKLKPGTKIWIFYDDQMEIINIEERSNEFSPQHNPHIRYKNNDDGGGGG